MHDFRRLEVWQKSLELGVAVYRVTRSFPIDERYGMTSQIRRGAVSVVSNTAEGSGRSSAKDVTRFLDMARGSASEVEAQALLGTIGFLDTGSARRECCPR